MPYLVNDCETESGCKIPTVSKEIKTSVRIRQDLHNLTKMGWPDKYKQEYIQREYTPDIHMMQLSMLADEIIDTTQKQLGANK